ncbi:MAG: GSCFA domain-containing protein [Prevotellaceae bacterium]|nr:GSCFA domain-containing protein [Prevotellaceae bacterium]
MKSIEHANPFAPEGKCGAFSFTPVKTPDYPFRITYRDTSVWLGSCFTSNIGEAMKSLKFHCSVNPFGALYNPASILSALKMLLGKTLLSPEDLFEFNELWSSFHFHSSFSDIDRSKALEKMNRQLSFASGKLYESKYLFITFGTAHVFRLKTSGEIAGNCHKLPSANFIHECLSIEEIVRQYTDFINSIAEVLPELKIIFSVSPVRHLKDGAHNNQVSKSILILAIDMLMNRFPGRCFYFPAYEIVLDELRDYRFYEKDMRHLSETAIDYINKVFVNSMFGEQDCKIMKEVKKLNLARAHRPFNTETGAYKEFVGNTDKKENELKTQYPYLDW